MNGVEQLQIQAYQELKLGDWMVSKIMENESCYLNCVLQDDWPASHSTFTRISSWKQHTVDSG